METSIETPSKQQAPSYTAGILCHLLGLASFLGIPFGNIIAPLFLWLLKRAEDPFVDVCGKEAVNFQITISLYFTLSVVLIFSVEFGGIIKLPVALDVMPLTLKPLSSKCVFAKADVPLTCISFITKLVFAFVVTSVCSRSSSSVGPNDVFRKILSSVSAISYLLFKRQCTGERKCAYACKL